MIGTLWFVLFSTLNCYIQTFISGCSEPDLIFRWSEFYSHRIALKDDYHKKRLDMFTYTPVEVNSLETLEKNFIIPARKNRVNQENFFNNAQIHRVADAKKTNSAFTGSYAKKYIVVSTIWSHTN